MQNEKQNKLWNRVYIKGHVGLNVSLSEIYSDFLKEEKVVQLSHPSYLQDFSPCNFFLFL